jgi:hypothetical protein
MPIAASNRLAAVAPPRKCVGGEEHQRNIVDPAEGNDAEVTDSDRADRPRAPHVCQAGARVSQKRTSQGELASRRSGHRREKCRREQEAGRVGEKSTGNSQERYCRRRYERTDGFADIGPKANGGVRGGQVIGEYKGGTTVLDAG